MYLRRNKYYSALSVDVQCENQLCPLAFLRNRESAVCVIDRVMIGSWTYSDST